VKAQKSQNPTAADRAQEQQAQAQLTLAPVSPGQLTAQDLKALRAYFPKDRLGVKVQSYNKERTRAMLVLYLQHTDVQDRLEEVDPNWTCAVISEERAGDTVYVRLRLTLKGVSRENVGEGGDPKAALSDALKRAAMLFGVGRYLYDSETVWAEYNDQRDRFRSWTVDDYDEAAKRIRRPASQGGQVRAPVAPEPEPAAAPEPASATAAPAKPAAGLTRGKAGGAKTAPRPREELNRVLMNLYRPYLTQFPETQFAQLLQTRYQVAETRLMTVEQLEDLVKYMEERLKSVA
jgi:hypothetical protein